ncbi:hypothetical protein B0O80DRAFT_433762 [Mortierella sp. GBAus27b]|nr:hypothetical protein BGX31_001317 [Mortierella sp. GBA43]KAI8363477.1 hypothetical protein B0O80DRAFT_433762 [Mortierella sp. GBAus27b]
MAQPPVAPEFVYKLISPASTYDPSDTVLPLSDLDRTDGFYHLSTDAQVPGTANRFFQQAIDLLILKINFAGIQPQVKWEPAKGGDHSDPSRVFPHVYGDLEQKHVIGIILIPRTADQSAWDFSEGWQDHVQLQ